MSVKLTLRVPTGAYQQIEIYRSPTKLDPLNPGNPIATLPYGTTEYIDNDLAINTYAYYLVITVDDAGDRIFNEQQIIGNFPVTGPGITKPLRGDWSLGYMGQIPGDGLTFMTAQNLFDLCGITASDGTVNTTNPIWHKLCYNGKILFYSSVPVSTTLGITAGKLDQFQIGSKVITYGGVNYLVRCPRMDTTVDFITSLSTPNPDSEWMQIFNLLVNDGTTAKIPQLLDFSVQELKSQYIFFQERTTTGLAITTTSTSSMTTIGNVNLTSARGWHPVLEVINN